MLEDEQVREHLETLGFTEEDILDPSFTMATMRTKYLGLARKLHSDKTSDPVANEKFKELSNAYTQIKENSGDFDRFLENTRNSKNAKQTPSAPSSFLSAFNIFRARPPQPAAPPKVFENVKDYNNYVVKRLEDRVHELENKINQDRLSTNILYQSSDPRYLRLAAARELLKAARLYIPSKAFKVSKDGPIDIDAIINDPSTWPKSFDAKDEANLEKVKRIGLAEKSSGISGGLSLTAIMLEEIRELGKPFNDQSQQKKSSKPTPM